MRLLRQLVVLYLLAVLPGCGGSKPPTGGSGTPDLASVTLASNTVTAGQSVQGTVTLTSAPNSGSVTVNLSSSSNAFATVPSSVGVAQGTTTSTFQVQGVSAGTVTISASLGSTTRQSQQLTVNAPAGPVARFTVVQNGPGANLTGDACLVTRTTSGNLMNMMLCDFDGAGSTAPGGVTGYTFTIFNAADQAAANFTTGSRWVQPIVPCGFFDGTSPRNVQLTITPAGGTADKRAIAITKANPC